MASHDQEKTNQDRAPKSFRPKILVFSTNSISDPGIDLAGSSHLHYPPTVVVLPIPCSSGLKPKWILSALQKGFDGVFIAADGTDCPYLPDCTDRTAKIATTAQQLITEHGFEPARVKMAAICSVCAEPFVSHMKAFYETLQSLGPVGDSLSSKSKPASSTSSPSEANKKTKGK
ncbi:MAG: methyl-viologen-reducing hydrogenase subunit delta [Candidatus Aminicenantes bacterium 4484_214]|nr:MAG: methyl-viologen-reducing hydrogenase subunit delta [Candidatus Aminicenantes bacterium 4484_214]RLE05085.1 MAG: hydrogenase iron-sulfur subunit [Candidatus Aminicenantes bacterium]HDJ22489.1 hydrogenase iron-sulfur subunit [Candidatus Aminicenantes bacterium]